MIAKVMNHLKKAERGQSIIILAFAFVVLLGFVGLTTDVSLMFVRYATIRRAVDSASLAAASQMRQGTEEASVLIAAKQFVEFHGLDSVDVLVETCQTLDPGDPDPEVEAKRQELCTADQRKLVKVTVQAESPTAFLRLLGWNNFTLQASAISETAALDVVLIMDVSESMLTQTSYDDWAKIGMGYAFRPPAIRFDVAREKGYDYLGRNDNWTNYWGTEVTPVTQSAVNARLWYMSPISGGQGDFADPDYRVEWIKLDDSPLYAEEYGFPANASEFVPRQDCRVRYQPYSIKDPVTSFPGRARREGADSWLRPTGQEQILYLHETDPQYGGGLYGENGVDWDYQESGGRDWNKFDGFKPTYNYYGCCNDPGTAARDAEDNVIKDSNGNIKMLSNSADFNFEDLICQPFKGARDAVELFLEKIDFIRGDRVAFVTFDRTAFLINPWNYDAQSIGRSHMIEEKDIALNTLRRVVGVRAEPNFYVWDDQIDSGAADPNSKLNANAQWGALAAGIKRNADDTSSSQGINFNDADGAGVLFGHDGSDPQFNYSAPEDIWNNYPVYNNCEFHNAQLEIPIAQYDATLGTIALPYPRNRSQTDEVLTGGAMWDDYIRLQAGPNSYTYDYPALQGGNVAQLSYEALASCRGTNIGAALREANNALLDPNTSRRFGAVWVMVLLSDGAAGASDPVRRTTDLSRSFEPDKGGEKLQEALPYQVNTGTTPFTPDPQPGVYGAFGVCPYGTVGDPGSLVPPTGVGSCSDSLPETRHRCDFRPAGGIENMQDFDYDPAPTGVSGTITDSAAILQWNQDRGNLYDVDIGTTDCRKYDVDDYARDWADFIGLRDENSITEELLPSIYTIGFGLTFGGEGENATATDHTSDYLGEQMLRYIADVGDNNKLDNDYYQNFAQEGSVTEMTVDGGFGLRGPCQVTDSRGYPGDIATGYDLNFNGFFDTDEQEYMYAPVPPTQDCGNYFNAPNADRLEFVFDSIASKLFTRLTG